MNGAVQNLGLDRESVKEPDTDEMLCAVKIELNHEVFNEYKEPIFTLGPQLLGVLMELIDSDYADFLHNGHVNPYSQSVFLEEGKIFWKVSTLNKEAYEQIIKVLIDPKFSGFELKSKGVEIGVKRKEIDSIGLSKLVEIFYKGPGANKKKIYFRTPASFKQSGHYHLFPEPFLVLQNLAIRYGVLFDADGDLDEEMKEQLKKFMFATNLQLKTLRMPLEGVRVPGVVGRVDLNVSGPDTLANYVNMLLEFARFSGVGIKTSMGMGAVDIQDGKASK